MLVIDQFDGSVVRNEIFSVAYNFETLYATLKILLRTKVEIPMNASHSLIGHTAYADLLASHLDAQASELRGSIERKARNGRIYIYDRFRAGTKIISKYIGEGTPELEARLAAAEALRGQHQARRATQTRLARLLRAEGYQSLDSATGSLVMALSRIGVFRLGGTIIGTIAFRFYEGELGVRPGTALLAQTGDLDIASFERLSLALGDTVTESVNDVLGGLNFSPIPSLDNRRVWRWKDASTETLVEFLTPAFGDEGIRDLPALGVSAQALHYLNYLIADPVKAVALYRSGVLVQIPRPERYAVHKLIVATRRSAGIDSLKARKDRAQAAFLIEVLAQDRPDELAEAWAEARGNGPRWRARLDMSLARMPQTAALLAQLA